jgi:hypothetical protein
MRIRADAAAVAVHKEKARQPVKRKALNMTTVKIEIDTETAYGKAPHSHLVDSAKKIGFISPISADAVVSDDQAITLYGWFLKGLNDNGANKEKKHKRAYGGLAAAVAECNSSPKKELIVTCGGSIAYEAAASNANTVPFVSLVGVAPTRPPALFRGGVSLDSFSANRERLSLLMNASPALPGNLTFARDKIGLFCNRNSAMHQLEWDNWNPLVGKPIGNNDQVIFGGNDAQGNNSSTVYDTNFAQATNKSLTALIISADPFFQDTKADLVKAANTWIEAGLQLKTPENRYVCYPALAYANTSEAAESQPKKNYATLFGPKLEDAYYLLGVVASAALKMADNETLPLIRIANTRKDVT